MAKIFGLQGVLTGKIGNSVFAVRNGQQLARQYQPIVANPSTPSQIEARAKLKLISQLSAVMAPVIAMPREGVKSPRNLFVTTNYGLMTYNNNQADVTLADVKLTKSVVGMPAISAVRNETTITALLGVANSDLDVTRVVYAAFEKQTDGSLRLLGSSVATQPVAGENWAADIPYTTNEVVIYAYGVRDNTSAATAKFGNLQTVTAETVAKLIVTSALRESDITLTETRSAILAAV